MEPFQLDWSLPEIPKIILDPVKSTHEDATKVALAANPLLQKDVAKMNMDLKVHPFLSKITRDHPGDDELHNFFLLKNTIHLLAQLKGVDINPAEGSMENEKIQWECQNLPTLAGKAPSEEEIASLLTKEDTQSRSVLSSNYRTALQVAESLPLPEMMIAAIENIVHSLFLNKQFDAAFEVIRKLPPICNMDHFEVNFIFKYLVGPGHLDKAVELAQTLSDPIKSGLIMGIVIHLMSTQAFLQARKYVGSIDFTQLTQEFPPFLSELKEINPEYNPEAVNLAVDIASSKIKEKYKRKILQDIVNYLLSYKRYDQAVDLISMMSASPLKDQTLQFTLDTLFQEGGQEKAAIAYVLIEQITDITLKKNFETQFKGIKTKKNT